MTLQPPTTGSTAVFHPRLNPPTDGSGPFLVDSTYLSSETPGISKGSGAYSSDSRVNLQLRINARYKSVDVLPLSVYWPLHSACKLFQQPTPMYCFRLFPSYTKN
ncbi:unnamed protein product [Dibothriocephalus latus]|uniref:Uncharacterized protein n=1 Tax=Dibothriocephalus latus TaxID=60516 RepID=A0A3P7MLK3_DIBLA|nr:unnamed protein product [Dibothriocephalus latus]